MNLVVYSPDDRAIRETNDYELDLQYGDTNDFLLRVPFTIASHSKIQCDGTQFGGFIDTECPAHFESGDSIAYKGRTFQGVFEKKVIKPPSGQSHLTYRGDANDMLAHVVELLGLSSVFSVAATSSGIEINYQFYRYIDGYKGLRMALASAGARLDICCSDAGVMLQAVPSYTFGRLDSEHVYFSLDCNRLPVNHLVGLGKGEGAARAVSHWYADISGNVSQTQTLFGALENELAYLLNNEDAETLPGKTKAKLKEYQEGSPASVRLPDDASLDVGDYVQLSSAKYRVSALTQVVSVVLKVKDGKRKIDYEFGIPSYPEDQE